MANSTLFSLLGQNFKRRNRSNRKEDLDEVKLSYAFQEYIDEVMAKFPNLREFTVQCTSEDDQAILVNLIDTNPWPGVTVVQITESLYKVVVNSLEDDFGDEF